VKSQRPPGHPPSNLLTKHACIQTSLNELFHLSRRIPHLPSASIHLSTTPAGDLRVNVTSVGSGDENQGTGIVGHERKGSLRLRGASRVSLTTLWDPYACISWLGPPF